MPKTLLLTPKTHHVYLKSEEKHFPTRVNINGHIGSSDVNADLTEVEIRKLRIWLTDLEVQLSRKRKRK